MADFVPGVIEKISVGPTGGASMTDVLAHLTGTPQVSINDDRVPTGTGLDRRVGVRRQITVPFHSQAGFIEVAQLMASRALGRLDITYVEGVIHRYDPVRFLARPVFTGIQDQVSVLIGAHGAAAPPTGYTDLGPIRSGARIETVANATQDGQDLPLYTVSSITFSPTFFKDVTATMATYKDQKCAVAIKHPDDSYTVLRNVFLGGYGESPEYGLDKMIGFTAEFLGSGGASTTLVNLPASPPNYFFGWELQAFAFGYQLSDILTIV